jgi:hypothetical protein
MRVKANEWGRSHLLFQDHTITEHIAVILSGAWVRVGVWYGMGR